MEVLLEDGRQPPPFRTGGAGPFCGKLKSKLSRTTRKVYDEVRAIVPLFIEDTPKYEEIENIINYLRNK